MGTISTLIARWFTGSARTWLRSLESLFIYMLYNANYSYLDRHGVREIFVNTTYSLIFNLCTRDAYEAAATNFLPSFQRPTVLKPF